MKVLHVVLSYFPAHRHGGPITSVHAMNKALVRAGADVTVYTTNIDGRGTLDVPLERETVLDGVKIIYFPITWRAWVYSRAFHKALATHAEEFDVIHITSVFLSASALGACYAKKFGVPYLISPRGSLMKEPLAMKNAFLKKLYLLLIERRNLAGAAAIHFTTEKEKNEYVAAELPLKHGIVVPNAYEEEKRAWDGTRVNVRRKFGIPESAPIVLSLGRITWKKGFDTLIPAFKKAKGQIPDAVLVVAGNDEEGYENVVKYIAEKEEVTSDIKFTEGLVLGAEKDELLKTATAFVLPSYSENFGMAPVESMAHGTAVIVTKNVGIAEDVERAGAGIVVGEKTKSENRIGEFAEAMVKVLREEKGEKRMGAKGRLLVQEAYAPAKVAERFLRTYNEIANHGKVL